jgi:hypothetical protein
MKRTNFLITTILSTLLLSNTIAAKNLQCKGGKCFIDISKLTQTKDLKSNSNSNSNSFKKIASLEELNHSINNKNDIETIVLEHSKYIMSDAEKIDYLNEDTSLEKSEEIIVLNHSKYVMSDAEKADYYSSQDLNNIDVEYESIIIPSITLEEGMLTQEITLPHSELYCDNSKQAKFYPELNEYKCV